MADKQQIEGRMDGKSAMFNKHLVQASLTRERDERMRGKGRKEHAMEALIV